MATMVAPAAPRTATPNVPPVAMPTARSTPAAPPMAQINVRIDRELKEAGDAVLARLGVSPSQIVRDLWAKLAECRDNPQQVLEALQLNVRTAEEQAEIDRKLAIIDRATTRLEEFAKRYGLSLANCEPLTEEELEEARWEEYLERGKERGYL